jgi:hypothetical protein
VDAIHRGATTPIRRVLASEGGCPPRLALDMSRCLGCCAASSLRRLSFTTMGGRETTTHRASRPTDGSTLSSTSDCPWHRVEGAPRVVVLVHPRIRDPSWGALGVDVAAMYVPERQNALVGGTLPREIGCASNLNRSPCWATHSLSRPIPNRIRFRTVSGMHPRHDESLILIRLPCTIPPVRAREIAPFSPGCWGLCKIDAEAGMDCTEADDDR